MKHFFTLVTISTIVISIIATDSFSQNLRTSKVNGVNRNSNACGVIASFTPDNDSLVSGPFNVSFSSTSTNATSVTWYVNGWWNSSSNTFQFSNSTAGVYEIRLVATNGNCSDTASCFYFYPGAQPESRNNLKGYYGLPAINDYSTSFISLKDGGYLMGGYSHVDGNSKAEKGLLIKVSESGCINWSKIIPGPDYANGRVYKVVELADGSYAVSGYNGLQPYLLKLDKQGNLLWEKKYTMAGDPFGAQFMATTSDGGFVLVGQYWASGLAVVRTNATGDVIWSRVYKKPSSSATFYSPTDVLQKGNDIYITGGVFEYETGYGSPHTYSGIVMKLNDLTGTTTWTKKYLVNGYDPFIRDIHLYGNRLLVNATDAVASESTAHNTFMILDADGNVMTSTTLSTPDLKYTPTTSIAMPLENGDIYFLNTGTETLDLQPYYAYHSNFIAIDANNQVKWARDYGARGEGRYFFGAIGENKTFAAIGDEYGSLLSTYGSLSDKIQFKKVDPLGGFDEPSCNFWGLTVTLAPNNTQTTYFNWTTDEPAAFVAKDTAAGVNTVYSQVRYVCPMEFVDSCSFIKVTGVASICNLSQTYTFKAHRNKACNEPVTWETSSNIQIIKKTNDSISVKFNDFGQYKIAASLPYTCSPIKDSMFVEVASSSPPLNIGADTSLCAHNTMTLHTGTKFLHYKWQDGSTDSLFAVTDPGKYWVTVSDSCDNILSDTIFIAAAASVPLSIGADRVKCNDDTIQLQAPDGFLNYKWSNNYNLSSFTSQSVVVNPTVDTAYYLMAEKSPGCFGFDTVKVKVNRSPAIKLGNDTTLCSNDGLILDAGTGFVSYLWNDGSLSSSLKIQNAGLYTVKAKDANGCFSSDTIQIDRQKVPFFSLGRDTVLCNGDKIILKSNVAGTALWQDGSVQQGFSVTKEGLYWLQLSDKGCSFRDTILIDFKPAPIVNLGNDTTICEGTAKLLTISQPYTGIRWQNNSTAATYNAADAGTYWVVVDLNGCSSADTINIFQKLKPKFDLGKDTFLCIGQTLLLKVEGTATTYRWDDGSTASGYIVRSPGTYKVTATNECGNFSDEIVVAIGVCNIEMPTAFTPNNDGLNDFFRIKYPQSVKRVIMKIFNRLGQPVFSSSDASKGWDGTVKGMAQDSGNYIWTITYETIDGAKGSLKGSVLLIR